jgi:imidazolonepropionase-like amidohydrolase
MDRTFGCTIARMHILLLAALVLTAAPAQPQERVVAFVGARIIPISGPEIPDGVLVVRGGRIVEVGASGKVQIPDGAERRDVRGKVLMPGLVDSHSHVGGVSGADQTAPIQADVRAFDSIDVRDPRIQKAQAGGITTVNVMPGSSHLLSGQTVYLKLRDGGTIDELALRRADGQPLGGMKMANGTNSLRTTGPFPGTRARSAALLRDSLTKAVEYREKVRRAAGAADKLPPRDLAMEALVEVLEGRRVVHFHTHRHDDILTALRLSKEFGFRIVLHHLSDGWRVADEIAAAGAPASLTVVDSPGGKIEAMGASFATGAALERAGVLVAFHTDDSITDSRLLLRSAALAVRAGMTRQKALEAVTIAPARMLDLADRVGSLEAGKDADVVVLSGDPLSVYTKVLETWVDGVRVFDRADPKDRLFAVGGYGAGDTYAAHDHCTEDGE